MKYVLSDPLNKSQHTASKLTDDSYAGLEPQCIGVEAGSINSHNRQSVKSLLPMGHKMPTFQEIKQNEFRNKVKASAKMFGYEPLSR